MRSTTLSLGIGLARATLLALPALTMGCEETPPPVAPATPVATASAVAAQPAATVELTPVAEPADIFVVARWKNPKATLAGLGTCAGVPQTLIDIRANDLLDRALSSAFRAGVDGRQIAEAIALDAPIDLVVSLDTGRRGQPDALFAFSVGLTSLDRAQRALSEAGPLVELTPGLFRVGPRGASELSCVVGAAAGQAPARLICGTGDRDVSALGPYLARNVPVAPPPAHDVHAEIRFTPVEARFGTDLGRLLAFLPNLARMQSIGEPRFDDALAEGATALAGEGQALASDLDHLTLDLSVDSGSTCLTASGALQLRGKRSWFANVIADRSDKQGPPPAIFWRAPVDSESANYSHAADADRTSGILRVLRGLVEGRLAHDQVGSEADRRALGALLRLPVGKDTSVVVASGHAHGVDAHGAATSGSKPTAQQMAELIAQRYLGWYLLGFDEGPAGLRKLITDAVAVYGRKGLTDPIKKLLGRDGAALPTVKVVPAPAQLGAGALDVEIHLDIPAARHDGGNPQTPGAGKPKKEKKDPGVSIHVLLMGEAKSTWIAVGADRDDLVKRLLASKSGAPDAGTLAGRPGLEPIKNGKALGSGFITIGALTRGLGSVLSSPLSPGGRTGPLHDLARTFENLPHKGQTPIFLTSTSTADGPRGELAVHMSRGSFEDVGAILMTLNRLATDAGLLRP